MRIRTTLLVAMCTLLGCDNENSESAEGDMMTASGDMGAQLDDAAVMIPDAALGVGLETVDGVLTFAAHSNGETHIYSVQEDGEQRRRLTETAAHWSFHSVSPDRKYLAAVQHAESLADGRPDLTSPGVVWILDIRRSESYPITPDNCDAGLGGVSWLDDAFIAFAMRCDDGPSRPYLTSFEDRSRDVSRMHAFAEHMFPVRDVSTALNTSRAVYVVDQERCIDDICVSKPQIWLADVETLMKCQVTDADRAFIETDGHTSSAPRVGDRTPVFTDQLGGLLFSRNVGGKTVGPRGHLDILRVGLRPDALVSNDIRCEQPGTEVNLSDELLGDDSATVDQMGSFAQEYYPQPTVGADSGSGGILFVRRLNESDGGISEAILANNAGESTRVSQAGEWVIYARWILTDLGLTGER